MTSLDLKKTLKSFSDSTFGDGRGLDGRWLEKFRIKMGTFNLYGRIVTKKTRGVHIFTNCCAQVTELTDGPLLILS